MVAFIAATGVVLGAAYMLFLYKRVVFGELTKPDVRSMKDINAREIAIFAPLVVLVIWMGVYPSSFLAPMAPSIERVLARFEPLAQPAAAGAQTQDADTQNEQVQQ